MSFKNPSLAASSAGFGLAWNLLTLHPKAVGFPVLTLRLLVQASDREAYGFGFGDFKVLSKGHFSTWIKLAWARNFSD